MLFVLGSFQALSESCDITNYKGFIHNKQVTYDFIKNNGSGCDLQQAKLRKHDLIGAFLPEANLGEADLRGAFLIEVVQFIAECEPNQTMFVSL